jgi:hypothetical protein
MDETPSRTTSDFKYRVALSFAGEDRTYVDAVAEELKHLGIADYFLDSEHDVELWGKDLVEYFERVFFTESLYVVVFVSSHYAAKQWTRHELRSAMARALTEKNEYILPARFDDTELKGILPTVAYIDLKNRSPQSLAALVAEKIRQDKRSESAAGSRSNGTNNGYCTNVDELACRVLDYSADTSKDTILASTLIEETKAIARYSDSEVAPTVQSKEDVQRIVDSTGKLVGPLSNALAKLGYFKGAVQARWIVDTIERIGQACLSSNQAAPRGGLVLLPATIAFYAALVGAYLGEHMDLMAMLLLKPRLVADDGTRLHLAGLFNTMTVFGRLDQAKLIPGDYIWEYGPGVILKDLLDGLPFRELASCPARFTSAYECTEYAIGLSCMLFHDESTWIPPKGTLVAHFDWRSDEREQQALFGEIAASGLLDALQNCRALGVSVDRISEADTEWRSRLKTPK